ncbi:apolipoprotein Eb-like [Xyrichtys novacula]|uniref:Apolipoprotein Eb-like n=1 Tax=Xyrichtys novacula TaxID=13765 RepID=A0AAV1FP09_XYRNO|nr:apolipoprotein Eb-like [Xyrichtys novacula]
MKVLLLLVLVVFTGCNANPHHARGHKPKLDVLFDTLSDPAELTRVFKQSEFGRDVSDRLVEGRIAANKFVGEIWENLDLSTRDALAGVYLDLINFGMAASVRWDRSELKQMLKPVTETVDSVVRNVESELTQRARQVKDVVSPHFETLMEKVEPVAQTVQARLESFYQSLFKSS